MRGTTKCVVTVPPKSTPTTSGNAPGSRVGPASVAALPQVCLRTAHPVRSTDVAEWLTNSTNPVGPAAGSVTRTAAEM